MHPKMLLNVIKGLKDFDEVDNIIHCTYSLPCYLRSLLCDDKEWTEVLQEQTLWFSSLQLRHLFTTIIFCEVLEPIRIFKKF